MKRLVYYPGFVFLYVMATMWTSCRKTTVIYPGRKDIIEAVYASGKILPENEYTLSALSNGTILKKMVMDGDSVKKGQVLYIVRNESISERLDAAAKNYAITKNNLSGHSPLLNDLRLSLENAEIRLSNDSITYKRWKNLWNEGIGTQSNLDNVYNNYLVSQNNEKIASQKYNAALNDLQVSHSNAKSQLAAVQKEFNDYYIRSDHEGVVYQTFKEAGESVRSNETVALLGDQKGRVIRLAVDQQDIDRVHTGQKVLLQTDITGDKIYEAVVSTVYPVMNEADQTFRVDARFITLPDQNFIHSSIEANIIIQEKKQALVLPHNVMVDKDSLWVQGMKTKKWVQTGISTLDYIEIISGVNEKTPIVAARQK